MKSCFYGRWGFVCLSLPKRIFSVVLLLQLFFLCVSSSIHAQTKTLVKGLITNEKGAVIAGASVTEKGTTSGVITSETGRFTLTVSKQNATLIISYTGYTSIEVVAQGSHELNITLQPNSKALDEVVVVGYGSQKKANVTSAVTTISSVDVLRSASVNVSNALAGVSPGLVINNRTGKPGADDALILIRGYNTFANGSTGVAPLIVVDGIPDRNMNRINPQDIESISVLKDASAAIYGVRAANGVILVTTKRGKSAKPTILYDGNVAEQHLTRIAPRVNAWQYMTYYNELNVINGTQITYDPATIAKYKTGNDSNYTSTDWTDQVFRAWAPQTSHSLSVNGGSDAVHYHISGQFIQQKSNYRNSNLAYQNFNLRSNLDVKINDYIKVNLDLAAWKEDSKNPAITDASIMHEMVSIYPYIPVYWQNGLPSGGLGYGRNPILMTSSAPGYNNTTYLTFNPKAGIDIQLPFITKGLSLSGYGGFDFISTFNKFFERPWHAYGYNQASNTYTDQYASTTISQLSQTNTLSNENTLFVKLGYDRQFGLHNISAFAAYEQTTYNLTNTYAYRDNLLSNNLDQLFTGATDAQQQGTGSAAQWGRASYFSKIDYSYKSRYLLELVARYNGSFNFAPNKQWGMFPAVSAGWRISDERFFQPLKSFINNMKVRVSWGLLGSDAVAQYYFLAKYGIVTTPENYTYFGSDYSQSTAIYPSAVPNVDITWEKQDTRDLGIDMNLLNNKLSFSFDYFRNYRSGILAQPLASIPLYTGLSLPAENIGKSLNRGFEFAINYSERQTKLQYSFGFNFTYAKSKVLYEDESPNIPSWQRYTGHTVDSWLMYKTNGIYHTQDQVLNSPHLPGAGPGDIWIKDIDGDGQITANDMMRVDKGVKPRILFGIPLSFNYKGFGLSFTFAGQAQAWVQIRPQAEGSVVVPPLWAYNERFISSTATPNAQFPRATNSSDTRNNLDAEVYLRSAAFLRLKTTELSYTLSPKMLSHMGFSQVRLYASAYNIFSIDGLKKYGIDPETTSLTGVSYPQTKILRFGMNLRF